MSKELGKAMREARLSLGWSMAAVGKKVAEAAGLPNPISPQAVGQWERGINEPASGNLQRVAQILGVDLRKLVALSDQAKPVENRAAPPSDVVFREMGAPVAIGPRDVPVLGNSAGGDDGEFSLNGRVSDHVRRPPGLAGQDVFALYVTNNSMWRVYKHGDIVYAYRNRPSAPGDVVIVELYGEDGAAGPAFIKELVRQTSTTVECLQYNPEQTVEYPRKRVKRLYRVATMNDLLSI